MSDLSLIYSSGREKGWLSFENGHFCLVDKKIKSERGRRRVLAFLYRECCALLREKNIDEGVVRQIWNEEVHDKMPKDLPFVIGKEGFLRMYAQAESVSFLLFFRIWSRLLEAEQVKGVNPIFVGETLGSYFDVDATPPGFLPKFFSSFRLKQDLQLLENIQSDLEQIAHITDKKKRDFLTIAILAHGACYREMEGQILRIPSLSSSEPNVLVSYCFQQHLLWEGVKTISAFPIMNEEKERGIYLCQGTEIWPSQPSMLGSIFANLGKEGAATEPYAHSWRRIHKHLRFLTRPLLPIVAGHSMGGTLATQIALYSHPLIEKAYAFNPIVPERREYELYQSLSENAKAKLLVCASIDDLPFWRIGSTVVGQVVCFLGEQRWRYRPLKKWEVMLILPGICKAIVNMINALPAHQRIVALLRSYVYFSFSQQEIEEENRERVLRFDHIDFFPKFYAPARSLLKVVRTFFGWRLFDKYLKSQIEIIELHEADLRETLAVEGGEDIERQLEELSKQKAICMQKLLTRSRH